MTPRTGPEYLAAIRAKLLAIVTEAGTKGSSLREASERLRMSTGGAFGHMRALVDSREVVVLGAGSYTRYYSPQAAAEVGAWRDPRENECREVVIEGRSHALSRMAVRSVFELGASLG